LCFDISPYSLNCHGVAVVVKNHELCRITLSSRLYRTESVSVMGHAHSRSAAEGSVFHGARAETTWMKFHIIVGKIILGTVIRIWIQEFFFTGSFSLAALCGHSPGGVSSPSRRYFYMSAN